MTEDILLLDEARVLDMFKRIQELGVRILFDDFGTGYASLSYLKKFPLDGLKIDRSFVTGFEDDQTTTGFLSAIVDMGHTLGLTVTAEGIETEPQREMLRDLGCTEMQGFLFSRPQPVATIRTLLSRKPNAVAAA